MIFIISTWKGLILEIKQFKYFSAVLITTLIYVFTFATGCDAADNRSIKRAKGDSGGQRVALVIGNADYENGHLRNPVNDARAITQTLEKLNFEVIKGENFSQIQMRRAIDHFGRKLRGAEVGLFFYAGHGMAADGNNYLIPVGAKLADKPDCGIRGGKGWQGAGQDGGGQYQAQSGAFGRLPRQPLCPHLP